MISRYTRPEMGRIWEPENRYRIWLEIEILICEALAELGEIPHDALYAIKKKASFDPGRIEEIERITRHDVVAFVQCVSESVGEEAKYIHMGVTSSDILDTSLAICMRDASDIIIKGLECLMEILKNRALEHRYTVMIGRTHGVHAEPITFGLKMLLWYSEVMRAIERMKRARQLIAFGKIAGAVGTYAHIPPFVERYVCERLGLHPEPISSQIISRDRHAEYFLTLAVIASSIEKFALEIRHLQRTEVLELEEPFGIGQKGSSAMPHKRNPVLSENLCGLARIVRANAMAALEDVALWHERDISHSSVERIIAPDSTILLDYMIHRLHSILEGMKIYPERMIKNLNLTKGLIYSEGVMLSLIRKGLSRLRAYDLVQRNAMNAWVEGKDFKDQLLSDPEVMEILSPEEIEQSFDPKRDLVHIDEIYERILGR
jgi:adenylosuccinate lyase